jgi:hypothetical protein
MKWRLKSHDLTTRPAEEHIAATKQVLGAGGVEHDARVGVRGDALVRRAQYRQPLAESEHRRGQQQRLRSWICTTHPPDFR